MERIDSDRTGNVRLGSILCLAPLSFRLAVTKPDAAYFPASDLDTDPGFYLRRSILSGYDEIRR